MKLTKEDRKAIIYSVWAAVLALPLGIGIDRIGFGKEIGVTFVAILWVGVLAYWSMRFINKKDK